uniref:Protein TOPAZ1 n=1 Tax=Athene cunicularia TaxID=194338 RepID=A0A663MGH1_ATHCN
MALLSVEEDTSTPAVKKLKTNQNISEDSKEKEPYYSQSPTVATLGGSQSKSFRGNSVTKKSGVQYKKRKPRKDQIRCLHCSSVTTTAEKVRNVSEKCDAEHCRNALTHSNSLLCAAEKNPFVRLEACSYINTFVKSSASGTTNSFKLSGFFHVAQDKRKHVFPDGTVEQSDMNCSTGGMQNEELPLKDDLLFNKEGTQNRDGCFLCCQNENSKCLRGKKWNIGRRPGKNTKITEKSAGKNIFTDMANECSECELQTEAAVAMSSSLTVLGLNHKGATLSASYDHTSDLHIGKSTHEAQNISVGRKNSTKLLAFENGCKNTSELSVIAKGENSNSVAHDSAASGSLRVLAPVHDIFNCHKSKTAEKLKKVNKKLQQITCQRTSPMTGKNVWPVESCARTSAWVGKNHESISEGKKLLRADFEESFAKSSVKAVGRSAVIGNLGLSNLHMTSVEMRKESAHKITDLNTECLTSLKTPESSSVDIYETLRVSSENAKSPVNMDRSAMVFNQDDRQEVKATLKFTTKQKGESKGAVTKRNLSVTAQNGTSTGNANRINFSNKASVVNETFSDLKPVKTLDAKTLTKLKIPLCRNKAESRKLESVHSFETKPGSPLERLDSTSVSRSQKTSVQKSEETFLVNSEQHEINSNQHDGFENLSKEMSAFPERSSLYPHPFLDGQLESSVPDFCGTEHVLKSNFPDHSWNAVDHPVALERNDDSKSRENLSQHKNQNFADILKAYEEDVLIIDVIQDDPDLFGTNNEEQVLKSEYAVISENRDSVDDHFRYAYHSFHYNNPKYFVLIFLYFGCNGQASFQNFTNFCVDFKCTNLIEASHSVQRILEMFELPRKYCRFYFMTLHGCERAQCQFSHVPEQGDEKICMAILRTYISTKKSVLLKRSVQIFVKYYREVTPGMDFASQVLNDLLISLLKNNLLQEVFQILNVTVQINTLPAVDVLLKVFEHVASLNIGDAVPTLISTFCKLIDAGMFLKFEHFDYIIKFLHQLQVSHREINIVLNIKSRYVFKELFYICLVPLLVAEVQHCKEKSDWNKLGALYVSARTGCEHSDDLQKLSLCIAEILIKDSETDRQEVPFCDFADAVIKNSQHNEADRIFIGRTGISVMCSYHKVLKWRKGRMVLDKLYELQINFTVLKGFTGAERLASRCQIVNKAAEIFLKTGNLDGATRVLRESEWTTNAPLWPCDEMDIINRQNLLYILVHKYLRRSLYRQAFEVLRNLPGFQNYSDTVAVSQYSCLFNKLLNACFESKNLGVSSSVVDFMLSKNIAIEFFLLRGLITALGRSCLWSKARTYYKSALLWGCYPPMQGNSYQKLLMIPSYLSEVEMLLRMEMFLVSNACDIQSPIAIRQTLQIILKRFNNSDYHAAVERLSLAARISDPKLILKHMTMNINMEEVYSLEHTSALKWLQENMKWAGKVWLFQ